MEGQISANVEIASDKTRETKSKIKNFVRFFSSFTGFIIFSIFALFAVGIFAYFLGYSLILDPLSGNDASNNLNYIIFLNKNFPHIPLWAPQMGGGVSATFGYPQLYSYSVIILHRIINLTLISSMGVINFLSLLLPGWGIYFFVALRLKSKTGGLIAGFLYLLSPMAYVWISGAGFLSQVFSVIFVAPFLIFYDWLLESSFKGKFNILALILTATFGTLAFLSHPATYMGLVAFSGIYTMGRIILEGRKEIKKYLIRGLGVYFLAFIVTSGFMAFWYLPLQSYLGFANRDLTFSLDPSVFAQVQFKGALGLYSPHSGYPYGDFSIYPPVWIMAILGAILGIFYKRKVAVLGILAISAIYFTGSLTPYILLSRVSTFFASIFSLRPWYPLASILNPIAAAMGAVFIARFILTPIFWIETKKIFFPFLVVIKTFRVIIFSFLSVVIILIGIFFLNPISGYYDSLRPYVVPLGLTASGLNLREIWNRTPGKVCFPGKGDKDYHLSCNKPYYSDYFELDTLFVQQCDRYPSSEKIGAIWEICSGAKMIENGRNKGKTMYITRQDIKSFVNTYCNEKGKNPPYFYPSYSLCLALGNDFFSQIKRWPLVQLNYGSDNLSSLVNHYNLTPEGKQIIEGANHRVDVTTQLGTTIKNWGILYPSSTLGVYTGQIGLIKTYYSLFVLAMYESKQTDPQTINNMGNYFGTEALIVNPSTSPMESFNQAGWKSFDKEGSVLAPPFKTGIATISNAPKILVIGSKKDEVYKEIFRVASKGMISFDNGILVDGPEKLGDVSSQNLSGFDVIILQGYGYKNREADLNMLKDYVNSGGSVFVDTGWQYVSDDWGRNQNGKNFTTDLPDPFPITQTTWGGIGKNWSGASLDSQFSKNVLLSGFGSLTWNDQDWSLASSENIRSWAKPILSKDGKILIAGGQYGKGKIVWSGMNLFGHYEAKQSGDENKFLTNIFTYLINPPANKNYEVGNLTIKSPEKMIINVGKNINQGETLYLREAYYPSWTAYVVTSGQKIPLKILVAGPQFMLVSLPSLSAGDSIIFEFKPPSQLILGILITILTILMFILFSVDRVLFKGELIKFIWSKIPRHLLESKGDISMPKLFKGKPVSNPKAEEEDY